MVYLFLANGFEEVEAITPFDYIKRAGIEVCSVGVGGKRITGSHEMTVEVDMTIDEYDPEKSNDMIILPGGMSGTQNLRSNFKVIECLKSAYANSSIAAICAAPSILGELGFLKGKKACCFPGFEQTLKGAKISFEPVVIDKNVITSRGAGTAQQFSFSIIEYLAGKKRADEIAGQVKWVF